MPHNGVGGIFSAANVITMKSADTYLPLKYNAC